jgi:uncharacterized protein DUF551
MSEWININNELPMRDQPIIGFFKDGDIYIVSRCNWVGTCNSWHFLPQNLDANDTEFENLTHWMPLPKPPKEI